MEKLREIDLGARVIIASADIQKSSHEMAATAGAQGFIEKPFVADKVLQTVDTVLKGGPK